MRTCVPIAGALDVGAVAAPARRCCGASGPTSCTRTATSRATSSGASPGGSPARAVIAHMHIENAFRAGGAGRRAQIALDNATARLCASIVAVSDATREALLAQGYPAARTVTIHNGIEPAEPVEPAALDLPPRGAAAPRGRAALRREGPARADPGAAAAGATGRGRAPRRRGPRGGRRVPAGARAGGREPGRRRPRALPRLPQRRAGAARGGRRLRAPLVGRGPAARRARRDGPGQAGRRRAPSAARPSSSSTARPGSSCRRATSTPSPDALDELLRDPERARRLGEAGRRRALEEFSADAAAERVLRLYAART